MKKFLIPVLLLSLLAAFLLSACDQPMTSGYVYARHYYPAYTTYVPGHYTTSCSSTRKSRSCYTDYVPGYTVYHQAEYELDITTCSSLQKSGQPKGPGEGCRTGWVYVDEYTFDHTKRGDYYNG